MDCFITSKVKENKKSNLNNLRALAFHSKGFCMTFEKIRKLQRKNRNGFIVFIQNFYFEILEVCPAGDRLKKNLGFFNF